MFVESNDCVESSSAESGGVWQQMGTVPGTVTFNPYLRRWLIFQSLIIVVIPVESVLTVAIVVHVVNVVVQGTVLENVNGIIGRNTKRSANSC